MRRNKRDESKIKSKYIRTKVNSKMEVEVEQTLKEEEKDACNSSRPNITPSCQRVHLPYEVLVKANIVVQEDYLKHKVEVRPNRNFSTITRRQGDS